MPAPPPALWIVSLLPGCFPRVDEPEGRDNLRYSAYAGGETVAYSFGEGELASPVCTLVYDVTGSPIVPCEGCEFAFDVVLAYDEAASDNLAGCRGEDLAYAMAYAEVGGEPYVLVEYYGEFYPFAPAAFDRPARRLEYAVEYWSSEYDITATYAGWGVLEE